MNKELNDFLKDNIHAIQVAFQNSLNMMKLFFPNVNIPWELLDPENKLVEGKLVGDKK